MKAASPLSKPSLEVSSSEVERLEGAAEELASRPIGAMPASVGASARLTSVGDLRIWPPAERIIALVQAVKPS